MADHRASDAGALRGKLRRRVFVLAGVQVALLGAALHASAAAAPETYFVVIEQMQFNPPALTVRRGSRIVWVNKDLFPHTASATSKAFDSGNIAPNASWSYVARQPGSYPYLCKLHPTMHGTLTVG